ncbi:hypothetical protein IEO21_07566 [Rhodonia placenta]|uniref:Uncharacterized protein n=1 Tax=Rhodonia placenta TaxID=104341 RepID=A0A8H7U067_9APHY|nr:hypothetical protein IEO21_07566 [Postia placenta]
MSAFLVISNIIATFNISKALDGTGREIEPQVAFTTAVTRWACRL